MLPLVDCCSQWTGCPFPCGWASECLSTCLKDVGYVSSVYMTFEVSDSVVGGCPLFNIEYQIFLTPAVLHVDVQTF